MKVVERPDPRLRAAGAEQPGGAHEKVDITSDAGSQQPGDSEQRQRASADRTVDPAEARPPKPSSGTA